MDKQGVFRSGTSGLVLSEPNKKSFPKEYQEKSRLAYYSSKFNSIEINSSFYKIPMCRTYSNWSDMVPEDFQFSIKLWKGVTHAKDFTYDKRDLDTFFSALDCLGRKKGCLLIQFPAGKPINPDKFRNLLEEIRKTDLQGQWRVAVEFRHKQWYKKQVLDIIKTFGASLVLHDMPNSYLDKIQVEAPFVYLRFHGKNGDYRGTYDVDFLTDKAKAIREWLRQGLDVYAYFNNTIGGAAENLKTLNEMIMLNTENH